MCGPAGTYGNERVGAFRVDSDALWEEESGAGAVAVFEACNAPYTVAFAWTGERGCLARPEVDLPDALGPKVLRYAWGVCGGRHGAVCGGARREDAGQARTATSAKAPFGSIAIPLGKSNWALVPSPSFKP